MSFCGSSGNNGGSQGLSFIRNISRFIGETVTIFTTSGGASGSGFTGVVLAVNSSFVRLVTEPGMAPSNPLADTFGDMDNGPGFGGRGGGRGSNQCRPVGSVVDIPIDRIAAFVHNAV